MLLCFLPLPLYYSFILFIAVIVMLNQLLFIVIKKSLHKYACTGHLYCPMLLFILYMYVLSLGIISCITDFEVMRNSYTKHHG